MSHLKAVCADGSSELTANRLIADSPIVWDPMVFISSLRAKRGAFARLQFLAPGFIMSSYCNMMFGNIGRWDESRSDIYSIPPIRIQPNKGTHSEISAGQMDFRLANRTSVFNLNFPIKSIWSDYLHSWFNFIHRKLILLRIGESQALRGEPKAHIGARSDWVFWNTVLGNIEVAQYHLPWRIGIALVSFGPNFSSYCCLPCDFHLFLGRLMNRHVYWYILMSRILPCHFLRFVSLVMMMIADVPCP